MDKLLLGSALSVVLLLPLGASAGLETAGFSTDEAFLQAAGLSGLNCAAFKETAQAAQALAPVNVPMQSLGDPLHVVPLPSLLNNARGSSAVFRSGGTAVHVYGEKSQNKNNWFLVFAGEDGSVTYKSASKILRYKAGGFLPLKNGGDTLRIGGRDSNVYIQGQVLDRMQSKLVIEPRDKGEAGSVFTVAQLGEAMFYAGYPVRIGGTEYRLIYTMDFNEDGKGDFAGFTQDRSIILLRRENGKFAGYHWYEREIPRDRILVSTPRSANADDGYDEGHLTLGLNLTPAGELRIYYPANPAVASR